ncbi:TVP38/TMEM64 family protein [Pontivivens ytuae]|uniref:TVP38/TMEM64 family membrane protein n=1 Tax=Pontivivens ytuae TaxID=2789856 RepID=A0A7S9LPI2_9RHOB|nr:VTT domain-containing protein [Pontivivens ytuae]QPH52843.1 TVP38/TMEM64 family protein [Pontivivens ytuae]
MSDPKQGFDLKRALPLIAILAVAVLGFIFLRDYLTFDTLRENREALIAWRDANYVLAAGVYVVAYIVVVAFSLPGAAIMTLTGGFLFGLVGGVLLSVTGATIGAIAIFLAAKAGLGETLAAKMDASGGTVAKMKKALNENEISVLFLMRLVPAIPFFAANLIPALVGVKLRNYAFTTFFGIMPGSVVYTWVGVGLGEVFARGESPNLGIIFEPHIIGPILGLCALAALPIVIKAIRGKSALPVEE